jgi:multisubunit Na+/H+ antiporter MnhF subunit
VAGVNLYADAANGLMTIMLLMLAAILRDTALRRIIALGVFTLFGAVALMLYSIAFERPDFADLGIALAILSFGGTMAYAHFFERWI